MNTLQYANRAKNIQNKSKKNETNAAKVVKELREQIERLQEALAKGGNPEEQEQREREYHGVIADLEYAKRQTWEEKEKMKKQFEESKWVSLAKNGMLQFKVNLMKKQKTQLDSKVKTLTNDNLTLKRETEYLYEEIKKLTEAKEQTLVEATQKQKEMDALVEEVSQMLQAENGKLQILEDTVARLQQENERLQQALLKAGLPIPEGIPQTSSSAQNGVGPVGEITTATVADYIKSSLHSDPELSVLLPPNTSVRDAMSDGVILWYFYSGSLLFP